MLVSNWFIVDQLAYIGRWERSVREEIGSFVGVLDSREHVVSIVSKCVGVFTTIDN